MTAETYAAYLLVLVVAVVVPGPTNTLIVANGMRHGARAGLLNVAGTQLGVALMIAIAIIGLTSLIATLGQWFGWIKLAGAAYLVWIGWRMLMARDKSAEAAPPRKGFFMQGFFVSLGNPKQLLFFGALLPQFVEPAGDQVLQTVFLGLSAIVVGSISDSIYALAAGGISRRVTARHRRLVSQVGGIFLLGGGLWLALARAR